MGMRDHIVVATRCWHRGRASGGVATRGITTCATRAAAVAGSGLGTDHVTPQALAGHRLPRRLHLAVVAAEGWLAGGAAATTADDAVITTVRGEPTRCRCGVCITVTARRSCMVYQCGGHTDRPRSQRGKRRGFLLVGEPRPRRCGTTSTA